METDEELETGHGPSTPTGDNLCNDYARGLADSYSALADGREDRILRDGELGLTLTDGGSPALFGNIAVAGRPLGDTGWKEAAARMHSFYGGRRGGPFLLISAWPTPDLVPVDFGRIGHPPLMVRMPAPLEVAPLDGVEIRPVVDAAGAEDWERALVAGSPSRCSSPCSPGACCRSAPSAWNSGGTGWAIWMAGRSAPLRRGWRTTTSTWSSSPRPRLLAVVASAGR